MSHFQAKWCRTLQRPHRGDLLTYFQSCRFLCVGWDSFARVSVTLMLPQHQEFPLLDLKLSLHSLFSQQSCSQVRFCFLKNLDAKRLGSKANDKKEGNVPSFICTSNCLNTNPFENIRIQTHTVPVSGWTLLHFATTIFSVHFSIKCVFCYNVHVTEEEPVPISDEDQ